MTLRDAQVASPYRIAVLHGFPAQRSTLVHISGLAATCACPNFGDRSDFTIIKLPADHEALKQWYPIEETTWQASQILEFFALEKLR